MTCNDTCIHFPVCEQKKYDFANIDECEYYREERPKGKWIIHEDWHPNCRYGCSICGSLTNERTPYCPNCGAEMEEEE